MPITAEYSWNQTETSIEIQVALKGTPSRKVNVYISDLTSLTQQATALAKDFGLQLMTPASVTIGELEQIGIDLLARVKALRESNQSTGKTKEEVVVGSCPEGALRVSFVVN